MSKGKGGNNVSSRRGNRTLAWYMLDSKAGKVLDQSETQEQDSTLSPALQRRKNSFDSESSLNSNGRPSVNDSDERKRRANKARNNRQRSQNSQTFEDNDTDNPRSEPIPINNTSNEQSLVGSDQQSLQQHFLSLGATRPPTAEKENYWYYDQLSDGFFYEYCGSRGWRKRNPKLHGNPPTNLTNKTNEENTVAPGTQTIEKKVYVPVPIPVFTNGSKFFPQAGTSPNIKYYDPGSDGFIYETATIDGWKRRSTPYSQSNNVNPPTSNHHGANQFSQSPRVEPSSLVSFPPLGRDLMTNRELEEFILAKMKNAPNTDKNSLPFASVVSRGIKNNMAPQRPNPEEYPSSSSTVSSSVSSDNATPPPANNGKENQCQQLFSQTKEPLVGSFEEPYEFYWSDNEKADNAQTAEQASSVSSIDDFNPLSAYFNGMSMNSQVEKRDLRVQRPSSLKIVNPPTSNVDKRLPNFNIDRFIADLPGNDNFMNNMSTLYAAPFGVDSPRTPFNQYSFTKESPMYTPMLPKDNGWARFGSYKQDEMMMEKNLAESNIERGLRDIERIWN